MTTHEARIEAARQASRRKDALNPYDKWCSRCQSREPTVCNFCLEQIVAEQPLPAALTRELRIAIDMLTDYAADADHDTRNNAIQTAGVLGRYLTSR